MRLKNFQIRWENIFRIDAILSIIIALGTVFFWVKNCSRKAEINQLTIFVTDIKGNVVLENEGRLNIPLGNRSLNEIIGFNGRTNFPDITTDNLGDTLKIGLEAEGWEIVNKNKIHVFDGESITLRVKRDSSLGVIKGSVMSRNGQDLIATAEILVGADTLIYSNSYGQFKAILPNSLRVRSKSDFYKLTISKAGFKTKTEIYYPNSFTEIRLEPKE